MSQFAIFKAKPEQRTALTNGLAILAVLLITSLLLALTISFIYGQFSRRLLNIALINAFSLSLGVLLNLFLTRNLVGRIRNLFILGTNFLLILGIACCGFIYVFLTESLFFFYGSTLIYTYFLINFIYALTLSFITTFFLIYQQNLLRKEKVIFRERLLRQQMEQQLFTAKLNPHFLFNSLNMIVSLLPEAGKAEEALLSLAELLRFYLQAAGQETIALAAELDHVEKYLHIQQLRFGKRLVYRLERRAVDRPVPPMIIQPLVENCIKHNIKTAPQLTITLTLSEAAGELRVLVKDSCARLTEDMVGRGTGLAVTCRRVELAGGRFTIREGGVELGFPQN